MGFKDVTKVYLSTQGADEVSEDHSEARWIIKAPIIAPNPNYKLRMQMSGASFPNTFPRISQGQGNDRITFAWGSTPDFDVRSAVLRGDYTTMYMPVPVIDMDIQDLQLQFLDQSVRLWRYSGGGTTTLDQRIDAEFDELAQNRGVFSNPLFRTFKWKPRLVYDSVYNTYAFLYYNWDAAPVDPSPFQESGKLNPVDTADPTHRFYKVVTQAYLPIRTEAGVDVVRESDLRLANVLGFPRYSKPRAFGGRAVASADGPVWEDPTERYTLQTGRSFASGIPPVDLDTTGLDEDDVLVQGVVNAESLPNLQGTQFIKVSTDLGVHGVDPSDKTYRKILGVVPILDSSLNAPTVFYLGEVQQPFYFTIAEPKLDSVQIQLLDDHDRPLRIFGDWMVELTVEFQEPESLDRYESLATFSGPAIDYAVSGGDPGQYRRLHRELSGRKRAVDGAEQSNRVSHAARTHGAHRA